MNTGYIKLYRKFTEWEWYTNINVKTLFIHCLLVANFKTKNYQGIEIKRGQFMTSIKSLSVKTGLSERQVRTALDKLILTNELTSNSNNKYRIITVLNYNLYQTVDKQLDKQLTNERQTVDKPLTTTNKDKKEKNDKKKPIKRFVKPTHQDLENYCLEKEMRLDVNKFYDYYESNGWKVGKNPMKDWKATLRNWNRNNSSDNHIPKLPKEDTRKFTN